MTGLTEPNSGTAYGEGLDFQKQMNEIYASMGVCPQDNLLWESLTGREHLLSYGRLKNLRGFTLTQAVEDSLRRFNLLQDGNADKQSGKYSGGMKMRLSVAISFIGDPKYIPWSKQSASATGLEFLWMEAFNSWGGTDELKQRYGGTYIFSMTISPENEMDVEALTHQLSPNTV